MERKIAMIPDTYQIKATQPTNKTDFELLPDDVYQVEVSKLELKVDQPKYKSTEVEDKFGFVFTVVEEGKFKSRKLWLDVRTYVSPGYNGKSPSWLYRIFCAVMDTKLDEQSARSVGIKDLNDLVGKQLRLVVKQQPNSQGVMKNKIVDVMPLKGAAVDFNTAMAPDEDIKVEDIPF